MWGDMGLSAFKKHTDVRISPVYMCYLCVLYKLALGLPGPDVGVPG